MAYLISQYPAVNHTFILREVLGLRALGMDVSVASVLAPDRPAGSMSSEEAEEAGSAFFIRPQGIVAMAKALAMALFSRPGRLANGFVLAIRTSRWNLLTAIRHLRYLMEAIVTGFWMQSKGLTHVHSHFTSTIALFVKAVFPVTISATIHGPDEFNDPVGFLLSEKVHAAEYVVAISFYGRSQLMRFSSYEDWKKIFVVRLGVNTREYSPATQQEPLGLFELICVGRLAPAKAQHVLLEACQILIHSGYRIRLRIVGGGPDLESLQFTSKQLGIEDHVVFHGPLPHNRVLELYRGANVFTLASFAEGVPVVLMEAMALSIPCVATSITGIPELIESGISGLLVPPSDADAFAKAVARLITEPDLARTIGIAARERVLDSYDLSKNVAHLFERHGGSSLKPGVHSAHAAIV